MSVEVKIENTANSKGNDLPIVCLLPGGPGLSAETLGSLRLLSNYFDLAFVTPRDCATVADLLVETEEKLKVFNRPVILVGHSFGGVFAAELALRGNLDVRGLTLLAAPLSSESMQRSVEQYNQHLTPQLRKAHDEWNQDPTAESFRNWFQNYGELFFSKANLVRGKELILKNDVCINLFKNVRPKMSIRATFTEEIKALPIPKLLIAGRNDLLFPVETLMRDANLSDCTFHSVIGAGHFVSFEEPHAVARLIEETFCGGKKEDK